MIAAVTCRLAVPFNIARLWLDTLAVISLVTLALGGRVSAQNFIFVTTTAQKISATGGCSIQEAIYSANFNNNIAIASYQSDGTPNTISTQCVAGRPGGNTIILPTQATLSLNGPVPDAGNPFGPTATPLITSNITIEGHGSILQFVGPQTARAFAVGSTGSLTIRDLYIKDFKTKGGDGADGGGGGLGAGGAIYIKGSGSLMVDRSAFSGNGATGGSGSPGNGGGGGGIGGNGGVKGATFSTGGGGGGSFGNGAGGDTTGNGRGGGTAENGSQGGFACGAGGGSLNGDGQNAQCAGGGGGGGGYSDGYIPRLPGNGGAGNYGGGGGGGGATPGGSDAGNGGNGGFGGGGGAGFHSSDCGSTSSGGSGGFGGGGGAGGGGTLSGGPGHGGNFGGDASCANGGGGAALGGAIFSDGGTITVQNSTFYGNFVTRGLGAGANSSHPAANGADAGGAIFAIHGSLTVLNSTVSGNQSTGSYGGIAAALMDSFTLDNTIITDNSVSGISAQPECGVDTVTNLSGAGNLITTETNCPGVWVRDDPALGALQLNRPGLTPTMAIARTSPAVDAGDPTTSLTQDQRAVDRPQIAGYDIGAYELCVTNPILFQQCADVVNHPAAETEPLTLLVSPTGGGTTSPVAASTYEIPINTVVFVVAAPNPGYGFVNWSGAATDPTSAATSVVMNQPQTLTANFVPLKASMSGNLIGKSGPPNARVWTVSLLNNGPDAANNSQITSFTLTQTFGAACNPVVKTAMPVPVGNLLAQQTGTADITIDFNGCPASARFTTKFNFAANGGAVSGYVVRTNQYQ